MHLHHAPTLAATPSAFTTLPSTNHVSSPQSLLQSFRSLYKHSFLLPLSLIYPTSPCCWSSNSPSFDTKYSNLSDDRFLQLQLSSLILTHTDSMASLTHQRRPSSWFGPQFKFESFSLPGLGSFSHPTPRQSIAASPRGSFAVPYAHYNHEPCRSSNLKPAIGKLPVPEPLFQDSYISEEEFSPSTPDPRFTRPWEQKTHQDYFSPLIASETLEDFGLVIGSDETDVLATYVSIVKLGKPKVIDILPPTLSRQSSRKQSPRIQTKPSLRPPIVWRMPSYDSTAQSDTASYAASERSESFDSHSTHSTYPSSFSDSPNTLGSFSDGGKLEVPIMADPASFPEPPSRGSISRSSTLLRRHSRNLSASFSKTFLNRLKDAELPPPSLRPPPPPPAVEPVINYSLPYSATRRPETPDSFVTNADLHINPQFLVPLSRKAPVLRRKKSIAGVWF